MVGASPLFPPQHQTWDAAKEELQHLVTRAPETLEQPGSRWQLKTIQAACSWLSGLSRSGVWQVLRRCAIRLKRGRAQVHSPDLHYLDKLADIVAALAEALASDGRIVFVFADEFSLWRQPSVAADYAPVGAAQQPLARQSHASDTCWRTRGLLNALTGQVTSLQGSKIGVKQLVDLHAALRADYPEAERFYVVEDNWPVHFHPDVLAALEPQQTRWELKTPRSWPTEPSAKARRLNLPIQLLPLPTYASWCNPIEKLWRWLKQELVHLHRYADDWPKLKQKLSEFLARFRQGSAELLRYVGLTENSKLFGAVLAAAKQKA